MFGRKSLALTVVLAALLLATMVVLAQVPPPVRDDPLVRMPGTQPNPENNVDINEADVCLRCHQGYNSAVEPGFNWNGSMMAQAARDFLLWPAMTVAIQDSMYALDGNPNAGDICERCHFPGGWLGGRSDPANASAMRLDDFDGVTCDFCHRMYDPFFVDTHAGTREGNDWLNYWDETNLSDWPSAAEALLTFNEDVIQAQGTFMFNGDSFFGADNRPVSPDYVENGSGQYFVSELEPRRASFADAQEGHDRLYSRYHKSRYFCNSCHDVSNPALHNLGADPADPLPTEEDPAYSYYHVERTWSEFAISAYGQQAGAPGLGPFAPDQFETSYANDYIAKCQDCHMRDVVGQGSDSNNAILRPDGSIEHPLSGQPLHDLTGGNAWVSWVLASAIPGSPNYDQTNHDLLYQGALTLTLDLEQGLGITPTMLLAGSERAKQQLDLAATIQNVAYDAGTDQLHYRIQNQTGHKLISGYPEGRRMFVNIRAYSGGTLVHEINPYDHAVGTLKGLPGAPLAVNEEHLDELVYEAKTSLDPAAGETTFHFVLSTGRYKDNRIPPKGFLIAQAAERLIDPVWEGVSRPDYFSAAEYAGGYDDVSVPLPDGLGIDAIEVNLYYQTTSREYIQFLRHEINATPGHLTLPPEAYVAQTDPFFEQLRAWGDTIWDLWAHNKDVPGGAPYLMAQAAIDVVPPICQPPVPALLSAQSGAAEAILTWSDEHSADSQVMGYRLYYDQAGKTQFVAETGPVTSYTDTGLTPGEQYCYYVTSIYADCESELSNMSCMVADYPYHIYLPVIAR